MEETRVDGNVQGVLKTNSKILEASELKRLDKTEKLLVAGIHAAGKGEKCLPLVIWRSLYWIGPRPFKL